MCTRVLTQCSAVQSPTRKIGSDVAPRLRLPVGVCESDAPLAHVMEVPLPCGRVDGLACVYVKGRGGAVI